MRVWLHPFDGQGVWVRLPPLAPIQDRQRSLTVGVSHSAVLAAAIGLPAVCDSDNEDHQLVVEYFVHHPVDADANAAKASQISLQRVPRVGLLGEAVDGVHNPLAILASNLRQVSIRAALDSN